MARDWIHTVCEGGVWINELEGEGRMSAHDTKEEAVTEGREIARARGAEHVIHGVDGAVDERNSYGKDPYPPRG